MTARQPKILAFAGSLRKDSVNKKLIKIAVEGARAAGALVTLIDLADLRMPIYDGDLEDKEGLPENGKKLKDLFLSHDGLLIASPEYNSSISGVLKNCIDWISRPQPNEEYLIAFKNKVAGLLSASPGYFGGARGLVHLRSILGNIGVLVLPDQLILPNAYDAFDDKGQLKDAKKANGAKDIGQKLAETTAKHIVEPAFAK